MYCTNCGAKNDDQMKFCTQCGAKLEQLSVETPDVETMPKKRRNYKFVYILAAILVIVSCTAMARNSIYRTVAPKAYLGSVFSKTISQISDEINKSKKELTGFVLSEKDDFTVELSGMLDSVTSNNDYMDYRYLKGAGINTTISMDKNNKQLMGSFQLLFKDRTLLNANVFLNDEEIGVNIPELFDDFWTAKTASFGREWNDSGLRDLMGFADLSDDLNISFSNIMDKSKQGITEETKKQMTEATKELVKNAKLGKMTSTNVTIGGKSVKASEIPVTISGSEFKSYLIDMAELYFKDENVKRQISMMTDYDDFTEELDEIISDFKEYINLRGDITIEVVEYKGVVVELSVEKEFEVSNEEAELAIEIGFGDNKALINDFSVDLVLEVENEKLDIKLTSEGNHIPQNGLFTDSTTLTVKVPYSGKMEYDSECDIDLNKGTINGSSEIEVDKNSIKLDYSGEYNNSKGLKLALNDVNITVNQYGETSKVSGSIDYSLEKGAKKDLIQVTEKQYVLGLDYDEFYEYIEDEDIYKRIYEIEEELYRTIYE